MNKIVWMVVVALVAVAGCSSSDVNRMGDTHPPRPADWPIETFVSDSAPVQLIEAFPEASHTPPTHEVIGRGKADAGMLVSFKHLQKESENQARAIGGDGILIIGFVRAYLGTNPTFHYQVLRWKP